MNSRLNKWSLPLGRLRMRDSLLALVLTGITISAHAGGLEAGRRGLSTLQVWLYSCAAVLAACYLIKEGVQCFKAGAIGCTSSAPRASRSSSAVGPWCWPAGSFQRAGVKPR